MGDCYLDMVVVGVAVVGVGDSLVVGAEVDIAVEPRRGMPGQVDSRTVPRMTGISRRCGSRKTGTSRKCANLTCLGTSPRCAVRRS